VAGFWRGRLEDTVMEEVRSDATPLADDMDRWRFVLLCRHGHKAQPTGLGQARGLSPEGVEKLLGVVDRLAETLKLDGVTVTATYHGTELEVRQTAGILCRGLVAAGVAARDSWEDLDDLNPTVFGKDRSGSVGKVKTRIVESLRTPATSLSAVLVVGHEPQLSWIAHKLREVGLQRSEAGSGSGGGVRAARRLPPQARARLGPRSSEPALTHAEVRCVAIPTTRSRTNRSRIDWSIAPTDDAGADALREKIRSKMGIAQLLGAFITLVLSGVVLDPNRLDDLGRDWAVSSAAVLFLGAIGLYAATMYAYDSLLMPSRFWSEPPAETRHAARRTVRRPPSSVNWILYQNMLRVWNRLFTPATALVLLGLLLLAYAALEPHWALAVGAGVVAVATGGYVRWFQPDIGSED
jgi:phosphohistidine phosphatase SixA